MQKTVTDRFDNQYAIVEVTTGSGITDALTEAYATAFWADVWSELLADRDPQDPTKIRRQFGTVDPTTGQIPEEVQQIAQKANVDTSEENWALKLWRLAGDGKVIHPDGAVLSQFWTMKRAFDTLNSFVDDPYQGVMLLLMTEQGVCAGFTAMALGNRGLVHRRFPAFQKITTPIPEEECGIFLDFAIYANFRKRGLGSRLFDLRIERLLELKAKWIIGHTTQDQPAQFDGNYKKRGLTPVIQNPDNSSVWLFITSSENIIPR